MNYNLFLVDADDTLLDFHSSSRAALIAAFEHFGYPWRASYGERFSSFNAGLWERLERKELTRKELMDTRFVLFLRLLGITDVDGREFNEFFLRHLSTHPRYFDGAQEFLQTLRRHGKVYIVTNGTAWIQKSRFDISRLWEYADDVFISDLIGADKPAKEYTDYVTAHIPGFDKERAIWIGDSLSADVRAANDAGIDSVWLRWGGKENHTQIHPTYEAKGFEDILTILGIKA